MQKKKKKNKLFIFLIICFVLVPFLLTKGCNYMESLNQAKNSVSEPISSISEEIQPSACVYTHAHTPARTHSRPHYAGAYAHERAHIRTHNAHIYAQAHSISKANWSGTAVPNTGYIENIYLNTNLSVTEVVETLNTLTQWSDGLYFVAVNETFSNGVGVFKENDLYGIILYNAAQDVIFQSQSTDASDIVGWNPNFNGVIEYNDTQFPELASMFTENDKLSNIFSITPFEQSSNNELSIGNLFTQLGNAIIIFGGAVVNVFISMEPIFWNNGPTLIFILLIASVSFALVFWGVELLISLIGVFKTKRKKKK